MPGLHFPWLLLCVLVPALGAVVTRWTRDAETARRRSLVFCGLTLACATAAWLDFGLLQVHEARDGWAPPAAWTFGSNLLVLDELSAPLPPLAALLYLLTHLATLRTRVREFSLTRSLASEAILLGTFACKAPWGVVAWLAAGVVPPFLELRKARKPLRVHVLFMGAFLTLLALGQAILSWAPASGVLSVLAVALLTVAVLLRSGIAPVHCWMTDLFEHASFGTALLHVTPMVGAYGLLRLVLPIAPAWVLTAVALASLMTATYAAGMAFVQPEARRFFSYLFLSHSSLVLVGLETATPIGLTGALSLWFSVALSLTGFGLVMRGIEARTGRTTLLDFHGLLPHVPGLATLFLLTGLASIGFPGTAGFVGLELLVDGAMQALPLVGAFVVIVAALNGLAVMQAYFRIFTGKTHVTSIDLRVRPAERVAVLVLTALILGGGLVPQPGVNTRYRAAVGLARERAARGLSGAGTAPRPAHDPEHDPEQPAPSPATSLAH